MTKKRIDTKRQAKIVVVCGSSGSGKSAWIKKQLARKKRVIIWDPDDEYDGQRITKQPDLVRIVRAARQGRFRYVGKPGDFNFFCRVAFAWSRCTVVAEEIAGVTNPGKAPDGWHTLVSRGRKRGVTLYAATQRPAESDKTVFGNATELHVGRMTRRKDRQYMAQELDVNLELLDNLQPLDYIHRDLQTGKIDRGKLRF